MRQLCGDVAGDFVTYFMNISYYVEHITVTAQNHRPINLKRNEITAGNMCQADYSM